MFQLGNSPSVFSKMFCSSSFPQFSFVGFVFYSFSQTMSQWKCLFFGKTYKTLLFFGSSSEIRLHIFLWKKINSEKVIRHKSNTPLSSRYGRVHSKRIYCLDPCLSKKKRKKLTKQAGAELGHAQLKLKLWLRLKDL